MAALACATLVVVLILLAIMQYRWIAELRELERHQLEMSLKATANHFADDFVGELLRVVTAFQIEYRSPSESLTHQLRDAYEQWAGSASYPTLIRDLYVVLPDETGLRAYEFDVKSGKLTVADWLDFLDPVRELSTAAHASSSDAKRATFPVSPVFLEAVPALAVPFLVSEAPAFRGKKNAKPQTAKDIPGWSVARLDRALVVDKILPALFESHFAVSSPPPYRVAIASAAKPRRVIYQSEAMSDDDLNSADLVADLIPEVGGQLKTAGPQTIRILAPESPQWRLFVKHRSGSLDAAVETLRRRNLAIGAGILTLLAASVVLILISANRARTLGRVQVEFAAAISHELRTPLSVIQAAAYNIEEGVVEDRREIQRYARTVRDAGRRLSKMVDQILLLAEMQSWRRQSAMPSICVGEVIDKAIEGIAFNGQHPIEKSLQPDLPMVAADSLLLRHCVQNLIVNALKYGEVNEEKPLKVSAEAHLEEGQVLITVADRGPGINQSDLPHIFKPFYRGKYSELDPAGNGLGLAVVEQLMERQLGSVTVQTGPYSGCRFILHIPIAQ